MAPFLNLKFTLCLRGYIYRKLALIYRNLSKNYSRPIPKSLSEMNKSFLFFQKHKFFLAQIVKIYCLFKFLRL